MSVNLSEFFFREIELICFIFLLHFFSTSFVATQKRCDFYYVLLPAKRSQSTFPLLYCYLSTVLLLILISRAHCTFTFARSRCFSVDSPQVRANHVWWGGEMAGHKANNKILIHWNITTFFFRLLCFALCSFQIWKKKFIVVANDVWYFFLFRPLLCIAYLHNALLFFLHFSFAVAINRLSFSIYLILIKSWTFSIC